MDIILFHKACVDGTTAAWAARKSLKGAYLLPGVYGQPVGELFAKFNLSRKMNITMVDFSMGPEDLREILRQCPETRITIIDHHATAIRNLMGFSHPRVMLVLDDTRSGAYLTWQYFHPDEKVPKVVELIDDSDRWQFVYPESQAYSAWLYDNLQLSSVEKTWNDWGAYNDALDAGRKIIFERNKTIEDAALKAEPITIGGVPGLICPSPSREVVSVLGNILANKVGTFAVVWGRRLNGDYACSFRSAGTVLVDAMAEKFGGGGHPYAAGCVVKDLKQLEVVR